MSMSNYLFDRNEIKFRILNTESSYIPTFLMNQNEELDFFTDHLSIFSQVNITIDKLSEGEQKNFLTKIIDCIKERIQQEINKGKDISYLPNIETNIDDDTAIIMVWQFPFFRVFFDIEPMVENSFFGYLGKDEFGGSFSKTEPINLANYCQYIESIMNYVIQE